MYLENAPVEKDHAIVERGLSKACSRRKCVSILSVDHQECLDIVEISITPAPEVKASRARPRIKCLGGVRPDSNPRGIMQLGLLLLIATPIARVMFSAVAFAIEGDRMYVGFTLLVLAVLLYSLFGSFLIA